MFDTVGIGQELAISNHKSTAHARNISKREREIKPSFTTLTPLGSNIVHLLVAGRKKENRLFIGLFEEESLYPSLSPFSMEGDEPRGGGSDSLSVKRKFYEIDEDSSPMNGYLLSS